VLHQAVMADRLLLRLENDAVQALALAYSPDGERLASTYWPGADQRQTAVVWDAVSGDRLHTLAPAYSIEDLVFDAGGKVVGTGEAGMPPVSFWDAATGDEGRALYLYDVSDNPPCAFAFGELPAGIYRLDVSPDGARLATVACAGGAFSAAVWDAETGRQLFALPDYQAPGDARPAIKFSPDGALLVERARGQGRVVGRQLRRGPPYPGPHRRPARRG
jgi:WD40 repeat protein